MSYIPFSFLLEVIAHFAYQHIDISWRFLYISVFYVNYVNHSPLRYCTVNSRYLKHCYLKSVSTQKNLVGTHFLVLPALRILLSQTIDVLE